MNYLVMDVGGTFVKYAIMDEKGEFLEHGKVPTIRNSREEFFASLYPLIDQYKSEISGIAVSMPGRIDYSRGYSYTAGALSRVLKDCPVADILTAYSGLPVTVGNDGKCAAAAEAWTGALKDCANGVVIVIGTGVGGGVVIDHKVHMGTHFAAGELSDIVYNHESMANGYSRVEAFKAFSEDPTAIKLPRFKSPFFTMAGSTSALLSMYAEETGVENWHDLTGEQFFEALRRGEAAATKILEKFSYKMASGIMTMQAILDVQKVAIGGGISAAPELLPAIQKAVHDVYAKQGPMFPCLEPEVVSCAYGNDANLLGALKLHLDH